MRHCLPLFDIDATILLTSGAGMRSMIQAGEDVLGPALSWDGIEASGGLDPLLFAEALRRSKLEYTDDHHAAFRHRYTGLLETELRRCAHGVHAMPGVHRVLESLRGCPDVTLGLLTGNYPETAALKLRAVDVDPEWFRLTVFGDEAQSRPALVALALEKFERLHGEPIDGDRVVVIGDTPRDVDAALKNGCRALGVATGRFSVEQLLAAGAHVALPDLSDPSKLWELLGA